MPVPLVPACSPPCRGDEGGDEGPIAVLTSLPLALPGLPVDEVFGLAVPVPGLAGESNLCGGGPPL